MYVLSNFTTSNKKKDESSRENKNQKSVTRDLTPPPLPPNGSLRHHLSHPPAHDGKRRRYLKAIFKKG